MKSDSQQWALKQLEEISRASGDTFEIVEIAEQTEAGKAVEVNVSVDCRSFARLVSGKQNCGSQ